MEAENLVVNPGFDEVGSDGLPKRWDLFVMPMDGAAGRPDSEALEGAYAAMLHNPELYPEEPANNWSQVIFGDFDEADLTVSGSIKTFEATEAALWLQCWEKNPTRVLSAVTTSTDSPVYGTREWTAVKATIHVPGETDFIVLRCVLRGVGTAWFDSVGIERRIESTEDVGAEEDAEEDEEHFEDAPLPEDLVTFTETAKQMMEALRESNEALMAQISSLERQVAQLREELSRGVRADGETRVPKPGRQALQAISPRIFEPYPPESPTWGHPLVPRSYNEEMQN